MPEQIAKQAIDWTKIIIEGIKILGPATIAAIVSICINKNQLKSKIQEIKGETEYKARENIYKSYQTKIDLLHKSNNEIFEAFKAKIEDGTTKEYDRERIADLRASFKMQKYNKEVLSDYLDYMENELKKYNLLDIKNEGILSTARKFINTDITEIQDNKVFDLFMEFQTTIHRLYGLENDLLEKKSEELFSKYIN